MVLRLDGNSMIIRYTDSRAVRTPIAVQARIWDRIQEDLLGAEDGEQRARSFVEVQFDQGLQPARASTALKGSWVGQRRDKIEVTTKTKDPGTP
jgi:hypothetical protein